MIRAKMRLEAIVPNTYGGSQAIFRAEYDNSIEEDRKFQKATPNADARFSIDNPSAIEQLVVGGTYYFDIVACDYKSDGRNYVRKTVADVSQSAPAE